ncbi:hypothetical protein MSLAZ_0834 [Methanosarcina lacustris Z-7289]|uniref:Uncharacterized protein n=1 Tax=Methanosarcina lacustris Z-7289 TaxID=1434111 RepID=A0A0E3WR74_9EURY|nr:UPF0228 family protein [Methanosarcina lacustris]AKB74095.1 hypothetical protein MSLAZ_0834 [Methanosarcina lacustris Z-7289]
MSKVNNKITLLIVFLIFVVIFVKMTIFTPIGTPQPEERKVAGLIIQFRDGVSEEEAKSILKNYNLAGYKLDFTVDMPDKYYIIVDKDKIMDVKDGLREENWTESTPPIEKGNYYITKKGDYYIITIAEQNINNKSFIEILNKYNLEVEKFVYCHVIVADRPGNGISEERANKLKSELEMNENVFAVYFETIES